MRRIILTLSLTLIASICFPQARDYSQDQKYISLRDAMHHAFNNGDSTTFFPAIKNLEEYLMRQGDLHGYYTQKCNEIVFQMNQRRIFEAYMLARKLSKELREKKVDKERFMAINMLGHINNYCGNKEEAKQNWYEVLRIMEEEGYYSSMPPIYLNIVNVALDDNAEEADSLMEKAKQISLKYSPDRVFDIEGRQTLSYYYRGDIERFLKGYKAYKEGEAKGLSSVNGRALEVYYLACQGKVDEAVAMAKKELGDEGRDAITQIYEKAGRWEEAYKALKAETASNDSIDNVVLINSMQGIADEVRLYDAQRENYRTRSLALLITIGLLILLIVALIYIFIARRKHVKELEKAYERVKESEKMKAAFIQNVSHEVRTPLNIISGFSQVIANPELTDSVEDRQHMSKMMQKSAHQITSLIDEIIGLSLIESTEKMREEDTPQVNALLKNVLKDYDDVVNDGVELKLETTLADDFRITTNENMLKRILTALLENACKYTEKGSIKLKAVEADNTLLISVEDTGCGIPKEKAHEIFERFVKLDSFKEGIGLGLPLSLKLAEQLGGIVELDTTYTYGARFNVKLPIQ
jgi:signal transduction histidine kinase